MKSQRSESSKLSDSFISIIELLFKLTTIEVLLNFKKITKGIIFISLSLLISILVWTEVLAIFSRYLLSIGIGHELAMLIISITNLIVLIIFASFGCYQFNTVKFHYTSNALSKLKNITGDKT